MALATRTTSALTLPCPGNCCGGKCAGELVQARRGVDRRTGRPTVSYRPCTVLVAQHWAGPWSEVLWA
jgi:hypothetical protein